MQAVVKLINLKYVCLQVYNEFLGFKNLIG